MNSSALTGCLRQWHIYNTIFSMIHKDGANWHAMRYTCTGYHNTVTVISLNPFIVFNTNSFSIFNAHPDFLPATGECIECVGWVFEVLDLDGKRIDKILASVKK